MHRPKGHALGGCDLIREVRLYVAEEVTIKQSPKNRRKSIR